MARMHIRHEARRSGKITGGVGRWLAPAVVALAMFSSPAFCGGGDGSASVDEARRLLSEGKVSGALTLLRSLVAANPDDPDASFVLGVTALFAALGAEPPGGGPWTEEMRVRLLDEAERVFRGMLANRPELPRPRLELARVLFERGRCNEPATDLLRQLLGDDCEAAARHFRRVLASRPPQVVASNVNRFLAAIRARKRLSASLAFAVAPDTNVNAATRARTIKIFDLPFQIAEDARASSGVGLIVSGSTEYWHPMAFQPFAATATRLRLGASVHRREYGGHRFDDMTLSLYGGPRLLLPRSDIDLLAEASRRWSAGDIFSDGLGLRLEGGRRLGNRLWIGGFLRATRQTHRKLPRYDGPRFDVGFRAAFRPTPVLRLDAYGGWRRARTESPFERYDGLWAGASAEWDLPRILGTGGFGSNVSHQIHLTEYDRAKPALHPAPRADRLHVSRVTAYNRAFELWGFVPMLSFVHERRGSNIVLHEYRRSRAELMFRRRF